MSNDKNVPAYPSLFETHRQALNEINNKYVDPIEIGNYKVYHYACYNLGACSALTVDIKADADWILLVQEKIYQCYA